MPEIPTDQPLLKVVHGNPSPEELATLVAVLLARTGGAGEGQDGPAARWRQADVPWRRPERITGFDGPRSWRTERWAVTAARR
ncbi:acyl-CoA carboxylase subunit epsilon [Streptomyces sp. H27-C3]|uniref:acyl-CoA carboxylase subunit epsilon n=1 Tax=Streptomyces sp. H27-C3 TaxID=3046305 RepID=UPI0024BB0DE5|nr:acyl-CoA carboxylase subunit epsilon [Streptomyces sp. H27-C3]MDJ0466256.1 acyl-CoA carboxylase subunit epsilon [Streptomyces sp. H27-C3]